MSVAPPGAQYVEGSIPCPRCAATVGPDQEWCLACGAPARTRLVPTPNWRAPVAVLAIVATLAGIALALAFVSLTNDTEPAAPVNSQAPPPSATGGQPPAQSTTAPAAPSAPGTANPGGGTTGAPTQGSSTGQSTGATTGQSTGATTGQSTGATGQSTGTGTSTSTSTSTGDTTSTGKSQSTG
jgi:hypothetical protein